MSASSVVQGFGEVNALQGTSENIGTAGVTGTYTGSGMGAGVIGTSEDGRGVVGLSVRQAGVVGESQSFDGIFGIAREPGKAAVSGHNWRPGTTESNPDGLAGFFEGRVEVTGRLRVNTDALVVGQITTTDIILKGGDCAEQFDIAPEEDVEPGAVVVLDDSGRVRPSEQAYDPRVVGVVSGAGEYRPAMLMDNRPGDGNRAPVALLGKVCCHADATTAQIQVGDLLTTSERPGHAMKASDPAPAFGAVIGKAMAPLTSGTGLIPILVLLR